jgi:hypothetical protein
MQLWDNAFVMLNFGCRVLYVAVPGAVSCVPVDLRRRHETQIL